MDLRLRARALDVRDGVHAREDDVAVLDRDSRSGRVRGRAGRRCGCPRCRTGRRGTGSRSRRARRHELDRAVGLCCRRLHAGSSLGPFACTGQPRCAQRFEMIVKLGPAAVVSAPLLRMKAVRRETSPSSGSTMNVATYHLPSGKFGRSGRGRPRASCWPMNGGRSAKPSDRDGDDAADDAAEAERRALEELLRGNRCGSARPRRRAGARRGRGAPARRRRAAARARRVAVAGPEDAEDDGDHGADRRRSERVDDRPTRRTAMPIAKPIGQRSAAGACGSSCAVWLVASIPS